MADTGLPQTANETTHGPVTSGTSVFILCFLLIAGAALGWFVFSNEMNATAVVVTEAPPAEAPMRN